jgi:tetratricopeptide (TPR) repeat protein
MDGVTHFSTRDAARILQATEPRIRSWARMGGVVPRDSAGRLEFTFQQLILLRTTRGLLEAGVPASRVRRIWSSLRRQLSDDRPLTSIRILADGNRAVAWDGSAPWQPDSGQFVLDFGAEEIAGAAAERIPSGNEDRAALPAEAAAEPATPEPATLEPATPEHGPALSAAQWFDLACELEETSPLEARQGYLQAITADPGCADAHVNLGRLCHAAGELIPAEAHYRKALQCAPDDAIAQFNLAVLLEDANRPDEAIAAYRQAIAIDPDSADAHYNLGLLLEERGRRSDAMRHLMTARRLYAP